MHVFLEGLSANIKDEVIARELPASLDPLRRFDLRRRARGMDSASQPAVSTVSPSFPTNSEPEPMQLGGLRVSAKERERRVINRLCMYCGAANHYVSACPVKASARQ